MQWSREKRFRNKQTISFSWFKNLLSPPEMSAKILEDVWYDFILLSPFFSHGVFIFNYDELSWRSLSDNTDNKLHICDNHLRGKEIKRELGKNLNEWTHVSWKDSEVDFAGKERENLLLNCYDFKIAFQNSFTKFFRYFCNNFQFLIYSCGVLAIISVINVVSESHGRD